MNRQHQAQEPLSLRLYVHYCSCLAWAALAELAHLVDAQVQAMMGHLVKRSNVELI